MTSYIYDIAYECIEMSAEKLDIEIDEESSNDLLTIIIASNINWQLTYTSSRKPTNTIPMLRQVCDRCGGRLNVNHAELGSKLTACMQYHNADRPAMGSTPALIQELIMRKPDMDITYIHRIDGREYRLSTPEIKSMLDGVPLDTPTAAQWLKEKIGEGLMRILLEKDFK